MENINYSAKVILLPDSKKRKRIINPKECQQDLKGILPLIFKAFHKAVLRFNEEIRLTAPEDRLRGLEALYFGSKMMQCLREVFGNDLRRGKYGRMLLYVKGYIFLFKKLNKKGMPMNVITKSSVSIAFQLEGNLFNCDEDGSSPIVTFGYKKSKLGEITHPQLVYIDEGKIKWIIDEDNIVKDVQQSSDIFSPQPSGNISIKTGAKVTKKKKIE